MKPTAEEAAYVRQITPHMEAIAREQEAIKDLMASAKDSGLNPTKIRKAAREILMEPEKRSKLYEQEEQLDLLRDALGLTQTHMREAAE